MSLVSHEAQDGQIVNNEAYILFYQRRKADFNGGECSGTSSTSSQDHWVSRLAPIAVQQTSTSNSQSSIRPIIPTIVPKDEDAIIIEELSTNTTKIDDDTVQAVPATSLEVEKTEMSEKNHDEFNKIEVKAEINSSTPIPIESASAVETSNTTTATESSNLQRIEKTKEDEIVDVESLDIVSEIIGGTSDLIPSIDAEEELDGDDENDGKVLCSELAAMSMEVDLICKKQREKEKADNLIATLSSSMPTHFPSNSLSSSFFFNGAVGNFAKTPSNRSSLNFSNSCSKDTLLYIDHHCHHELEELEDHHARHHHGSDAFLGNRSHWVSDFILDLCLHFPLTLFHFFNVSDFPSNTAQTNHRVTEKLVRIL